MANRDRTQIPAAITRISGALWVLAGGGCSCFVAGTPIATPDGPRPIGLLRAGQVVDAWLDGAVVRRRIRRLHSGLAACVVDLRTASSVVRVTPGHRIAIPGGWRLVSELVAGDLVVLRSGAERILEVVPQVTVRPAPVHNLVLDGAGAFFANQLVADQKREPAGPAHNAALIAALVLGVACGGPHERHQVAVPSTTDDDEIATATSESASEDTGGEPRERIC